MVSKYYEMIVLFILVYHERNSITVFLAVTWNGTLMAKNTNSVYGLGIADGRIGQINVYGGVLY